MNLEYRELLPDNFPGNSKVWIYQSSRLFTLSEALEIETLLNKYAPGSIINQKKTSFAGHPGLVSIVDTKALRGISRAMIWTYLLKNRVYLMSVTLDDKSKIEEHLKLMSL